DKVANYRTYDAAGNPLPGQFAIWFEELFAEISKNPKYKNLYSQPASEMHNGYFSQDKTSYSPFEIVKGKTKGGAEDTTYNLIMKDKERLLDMNTPLRFIFSHSALREGW